MLSCTSWLHCWPARNVGQHLLPARQFSSSNSKTTHHTRLDLHQLPNSATSDPTTKQRAKAQSKHFFTATTTTTPPHDEPLLYPILQGPDWIYFCTNPVPNCYLCLSTHWRPVTQNRPHHTRPTDLTISSPRPGADDGCEPTRHSSISDISNSTSCRASRLLLPDTWSNWLATTRTASRSTDRHQLQRSCYLPRNVNKPDYFAIHFCLPHSPGPSPELMVIAAPQASFLPRTHLECDSYGNTIRTRVLTSSEGIAPMHQAEGPPSTGGLDGVGPISLQSRSGSPRANG